jgi:hypothetical protein
VAASISAFPEGDGAKAGKLLTPACTNGDMRFSFNQNRRSAERHRGVCRSGSALSCLLWSERVMSVPWEKYKPVMTRRHSATSLTSNSCCDSLTAGLSAAAARDSVAVAASSGKAVASCELPAPDAASSAPVGSASWPGADGATSSLEVGTDGSFPSEAGDFLFEKPRCQNGRLTELLEDGRGP